MRTTSTMVRVRAAATDRTDMDRFMTQVKAVFPAASLRAATAPEIPADPAVVMSREHLHISWAILGNFVSNHSKFHARSKDPSAKDDDTASDSQSEASRDMGGGGARG